MEVRLEEYQGRTWILPPLLSWRITLTGSVPCDSFTLTCPFEASMAQHLERAYRVAFLCGGLPFRGVLDETEIIQDERGRRLRLSGRGMAALLLDNESEAVEYASPTLSELLRHHAAPCGVQWEGFREIRGAGPYTVRSGGSQWRAIADFLQRFGGFAPRMSTGGRLLLTPGQDDGSRLIVGAKTPLLSIRWRDRRYGVYSEVLVVDKVRRTRQRALNEEFLRRGGSCRRVLYTPGRSTGSAMRYTGADQIRDSEKDSRLLTLVLPGMAGGGPGKIVRMERGDIGVTGDFVIGEWTAEGGAGGETTTLTMRRY